MPIHNRNEASLMLAVEKAYHKRINNEKGLNWGNEGRHPSPAG